MGAKTVNNWNPPNKRASYAIGIDSGTSTGIAIWDRQTKQFVEVKTMPIHRALEVVRQYHERYTIEVRVEDARLAVHGRNTTTDRSKLQGAGSIKRDAKIWSDFLTDYSIPHLMVRPNKALSKLSKEQFVRTTKYTGLTSSHARDAAMIVYGL